MGSRFHIKHISYKALISISITFRILSDLSLSSLAMSWYMWHFSPFSATILLSVDTSNFTIWQFIYLSIYLLLSLLLFTHKSFSHQLTLMVFHWSLSDSKFPQVSRTRLRILAVHSNGVVWIVSNRPPTSKSYRPFNNPFVNLPKAPLTISKNRYVHVLQLFQFSRKVEVLIPPDLFCGQPGQQSRQFCKCSFFLLIIIRYGLLVGIRWSVCMLMSHMSLCVSFSRTGAGLCVYHLLVWSNLSLWHISQWITLPIQSCLALLFLCSDSVSHHHYFMVSYWILRDSKSPQVSRTLLSILANLNNALV